MRNKHLLLIISGGIAAYKSLELIRLIKKSGGFVRPILTSGGAQFVTPLSVSALAEDHVYTDLWSLKDESEMGHIRLSREADAILIAPASASIIAKIANGIADDLATTTLLAADKPITLAPAMNHKMWDNPATQANIETLKSRGFHIIEPEEGDMACGEYGVGRMQEPESILEALNQFFFDLPLKGKTALVTAGPTYEPIDPVRFIGNHSSGKQGYAIAQSLARAGANVTLVSGPTQIKAPANINVVSVQTAQQMLEASEKALPADIAICTAAVSDWAPENTYDEKIKKAQTNTPPSITLKENPDILKTISNHKKRPRFVIGFAAETNDLEDNAKKKIQNKGCDVIVANDVSGGAVFGEDSNQVTIFNADGTQHSLSKASKTAIANHITNHVIKALS